MTMFCVIATFNKEPCKRYLKSSTCYVAGLVSTDVKKASIDIGNYHVIEIFFSYEEYAKCYASRISNGIIKFDTKNKCLVEMM